MNKAKIKFLRYAGFITKIYFLPDIWHTHRICHKDILNIYNAEKRPYVRT